MTTPKSLRHLLVATTAAGILSLFATACDQGNTSGGEGQTTPNAILVSDGGGTLRIDTSDTVATGERLGFYVRALDPNGIPFQFLRLNCETERGLALLEPSTGFESTDGAGNMSGVVGGLAPGSYILECRGPIGSQLIARKSIIVIGDIPAGFDGFDGAGGGNLGGGFIDDDPELGGGEPSISQITFTSVTGALGNQLDLTGSPFDCDGDPETIDPEPFGFDSYVLTINNPTNQTIEIDSVSFSVAEAGVVSTQQLNQITIAPGSSVQLDGPYTDFVGSGGKQYAGTGVPLQEQLTNVSFSVRGSFLDESLPFLVTRSTTISNAFVNNCGA